MIDNVSLGGVMEDHNASNLFCFMGYCSVISLSGV